MISITISITCDQCSAEADADETQSHPPSTLLPGFYHFEHGDDDDVVGVGVGVGDGYIGA